MSELPRRKMGRTGMQPKALGMGAAFVNRVDEAETIATVERALELGIDFFDTYAGANEERWGRALSGVDRASYYMQAKVGPHPERPKDFSAASTRWSVEHSLQALRVDYLDSVLVHDPPDIVDPLGPGRAFDELQKMKEEGLIRHIGLGVRQHEFHKAAIEAGHAEIVLTFLDYTLLDQSVSRTTMHLAKKHGTGLILASVFGMGRLTGIEPNRADEPRAHAMWQWCQEQDVDIKHLAMQFCLDAPIDGIVMSGPADRHQLQDAYDAATQEIPADIWTDFEEQFGIGV
ncbi:MAG: aldo/keto reductase [Gemmatimonadetes bacterium]|jgi:aryl-alcohol dehydrogenase-like predicted oxidoreductase|nr:aldo/keto reductase [Gemmatimonadota bacterium]MDE0964527.1 aldo/keto reductase [Candidatus Latescibacterota bacterium]MBT5325286.1 aldo/keto reductase [Gemmatimonadota bacterium]MBT5450527.1 aldo/keto reductase [Gemmatimonadota bacterium]MBT5805586.1 aldo/keto reductase [Gemmatimonadota bacterium]